MAVSLDFGVAWSTLRPLIIFVAAMGVYSVFIFRFYRFLAKKDIIELNLRKYNNANHWFLKFAFAMLLYVVEYILFLPVFIFFWFVFMAVILLFLAKQQTIGTIFLVAMAVVGTVRLVCYYSEDLARDLAKMLPFAVLGVFLVDISYFQIENSLTLLYEIPGEVMTLVYYYVFIVGLEFSLRFLYFISRLFVSEVPQIPKKAEDFQD